MLNEMPGDCSLIVKDDLYSTLTLFIAVNSNPLLDFIQNIGVGISKSC
jgi:hypothetical protein